MVTSSVGAGTILTIVVGTAVPQGASVVPYEALGRLNRVSADVMRGMFTGLRISAVRMGKVVNDEGNTPEWRPSSRWRVLKA